MGKTRLAMALCQVLPGAIYAKQGTSPRRAGKAANYFLTDSELDSFLVEQGVPTTDSPRRQRGNHTSGVQNRSKVKHVVVESNALVSRRQDGIVLYLGPLPRSNSQPVASLPPRPDAHRLRDRAHIDLDGSRRAEQWRRTLGELGLEAALIEAVLGALEAGAGDAGRRA